jgi:hypothetical protein
VFDYPTGGIVQGIDIMVWSPRFIIPSRKGEGHPTTPGSAECDTLQLNSSIEDTGNPATKVFAAFLRSCWCESNIRDFDSVTHDPNPIHNLKVQDFSKSDYRGHAILTVMDECQKVRRVG